MSLDLICWLVSLSSLTTYLVACKILGHTSFSISATFFLWKEWKGVFFIAALWGTAIPVLVMAAYSWQWENAHLLVQIGQSLIVTAAMMLILVGIFANYKRSEFEEWMHILPSYGSIFLSLIGLGLVGTAGATHWTGITASWGYLTGFLVTAIPLIGVKNQTRWHEIIAYGWFLTGLLTTYVL
jgi:hypothetical protein